MNAIFSFVWSPRSLTVANYLFQSRADRALETAGGENET
jgi:hypothetical protein